MGTTIYSQIKADDVDAGVNGLVEYFLIEGSKNATGQQSNSLITSDGYGVFAISYPHQGHVSIYILKKVLRNIINFRLKKCCS